MIVPTIILIMLAAIPYIDVNSEETGHWFTSPVGKKIAIVIAIYTTIVTVGLVVFDYYIGVRELMGAINPELRTGMVPEVIIPHGGYVRLLLRDMVYHPSVQADDP